MKTPEQLKGTIRSMAAKKNLRAQEVLQMFLFERVLERLANSAYKNNFILKGGLLISSMIGIGERTTMDMDTTVRGIQMEEDEIVRAVKEVLAVDVGDDIEFEYQSIEPIREDDAYNNFRIHLRAKYGKIDSPMKIDVTTGDVITPAAVQYEFPMLFDEKTVSVMAYTLETVLAEKYETIIRRNIGTTRARDYYDLHILFRSRSSEVRLDILKAAFYILQRNAILFRISKTGVILSRISEKNRRCTCFGITTLLKISISENWNSMLFLIL